MFDSFIITSWQCQQHYIIRLASQGHFPRALKPEIIHDNFTASHFVNSLQVPFGFWESIASRNPFFSYSAWRNANPWKKTEEYVAASLVQGSINAYRVAPLNELHESTLKLKFKNSVGETFQLQPAIILLLNRFVDIKPVNTLSDAQQIMSRLTIDDNELAQVLKANNIPVAKGVSTAAIEAMTSALLSGEFVVVIVPKARKPAKKTEYEMVGMSNPGNPPPRIQKEAITQQRAATTTVDIAISEPKSLKECQKRLTTARENIIEIGYQSKYTDEELLLMAKSGNVANERFHVRFMEKSYLEYNGKPGALGAPFKGTSGEGAKYWSTTFDQLEDADTDPRLISLKLGLDYNPSKEYVLVMVDTDKAKAIADTYSLIPTHKNLGKFAKDELPDNFSNDEVNTLLTPEFQTKYAKLYQEALDSGKMEWDGDVKGGIGYFEESIKDKNLQDFMKKRLKMQKKLGNNQHFLGNGLTKTLLPNNGKYGAVETFNFERKTINLEQFGDAISITPVLKPIPVGN